MHQFVCPYMSAYHPCNSNIVKRCVCVYAMASRCLHHIVFMRRCVPHITGIYVCKVMCVHARMHPGIYVCKGDRMHGCMHVRVHASMYTFRLTWAIRHVHAPA